MKRLAVLRAVALGLACLGIVIPAPLLQAATSAKPSSVPLAIDVALRHGGVLLGQVVDPQGVPQSQVPVALISQEGKVAEAVTDKSGYFLLTGVRGGMYQLAAGQTQGTYRVWTPDTAPPSAQPGALLVTGQGAVRGQCGPMGYWLSQPWVIAGLVALAIAVPVAIHNSKTSQPASP